MTTTEGLAQVEQSSSYLNQDLTEAALRYVTDNWPHQQLTPAQREAWLDILCQLKVGELKPTLSKIGGRFRPDAYAVLDAVLAARGSLRVPDFRPDLAEPLAPGASAAAERVFEQFAHIMPSRKRAKSTPREAAA